jgi:TolA-binding protein
MWRIFAGMLFLVFAGGLSAQDKPAAAPPDFKSTVPPSQIPADDAATLPFPRLLEPPSSAKGPRPSTGVDTSQLNQQIERLRAERLRLQQEAENDAPPARKSDKDSQSETANLRLRLAELMMKLGTRARRPTAQATPESEFPNRATPAPGPGGTEGTKPPSVAAPAPEKTVPPKRVEASPVRPAEPRPAEAIPSTSAAATIEQGNKPVDPPALAQALFRTGDFDGALRTYRMLDPNQLSRVDRPAVQYMIATCLRRLGKLDEAAAAYRDVINSNDDDVLTECAQWQLNALAWRRDLETRLEQLRQRRLALESAP